MENWKIEKEIQKSNTKKAFLFSLEKKETKVGGEKTTLLKPREKNDQDDNPTRLPTAPLDGSKPTEVRASLPSLAQGAARAAYTIVAA